MFSIIFSSLILVSEFTWSIDIFYPSEMVQFGGPCAIWCGRGYTVWIPEEEAIGPNKTWGKVRMGQSAYLWGMYDLRLKVIYKEKKGPFAGYSRTLWSKVILLPMGMWKCRNTSSVKK